jgi:hypothetical protein
VIVCLCPYLMKENKFGNGNGSMIVVSMYALQCYLARCARVSEDKRYVRMINTSELAGRRSA